MVEALDNFGQMPAWLAPDTLPRSRAALESGLARETWKYSPLSKTLRALLGAPTVNAAPLANNPAGVTVSRFSELDTPPGLELHIERYPLAGITAALAGDGWCIDVAQSPNRPLVLSTASGINAPILLRIGAGCRVEVEEQPRAAGVQAAVRLLVAARDTTITWNRAELIDDAEQWMLLQAQLAANARLELHHYASGANFRRLDTHVRLLGDGSEFRCEGASLVSAGQHLDRQLVVEHCGRSTQSRTRLHNVAAGKGRCSFNGRIHIHPGAANADADLSNRNLALDGEAEINTKPELEIYTDDVKCAHGATVGQLDDGALFYLQSRGLPEPLARRLLCVGFLAECIEGALVDNVTAEFLSRLDGIQGKSSESLSLAN